MGRWVVACRPWWRFKRILANFLAVTPPSSAHVSSTTTATRVRDFVISIFRSQLFVGLDVFDVEFPWFRSSLILYFDLDPSASHDVTLPGSSWISIFSSWTPLHFIPLDLNICLIFLYQDLPRSPLASMLEILWFLSISIYLDFLILFSFHFSLASVFLDFALWSEPFGLTWRQSSWTSFWTSAFLDPNLWSSLISIFLDLNLFAFDPFGFNIPWSSFIWVFLSRRLSPSSRKSWFCLH